MKVTLLFFVLQSSEITHLVTFGSSSSPIHCDLELFLDSCVVTSPPWASRLSVVCASCVRVLWDGTVGVSCLSSCDHGGRHRHRRPHSSSLGSSVTKTGCCSSAPSTASFLPPSSLPPSPFPRLPLSLPPSYSPSPHPTPPPG